ncbi:DUF11 domain-containing protein [Comamonas piscis]|uniref:DUF11 domain-containing protein n=1 Tax=Comamonas piscis TaxID=1562974 RepID=A0A7G5EDV6_9BURK|nr:DUF11 domain-containing protein [Comamonas piscis]QMV72181.1 DUF11 domain-containing protein [Comamonas piscis]WSO34941.1 DUF11 domain-containing protein [Comamonas piscis]
MFHPYWPPALLAKMRGSLAVALVSGVLPGVALAQSTRYDIFVNHDAFVAQTGAVAENGSVDGPAGADFVYRAKVKLNGGTGEVANVTLQQWLPAGAIFQAIAAPEGVSCAAPLPGAGDTIAANAPLACTIAKVTASDFVAVDFRVKLPSASTDWTAHASAASPDNLDPDAGDAEPNHSRIARTITTYERADLAVQILAPIDGSSHTQGDKVDYQLQVRNTDSPYAFVLKAGEKAVVRFPQPEGTEFQGSPTGNGWVCAKAEDASANQPVPVWSCSYTVPAGQTVDRNRDLPLLSVPLLIKASEGQVASAASVSGETATGQLFLDADPDNNTDAVRIQVQPNVNLDMALTKDVNPKVLDKQATGPVPVTYTLSAKRVAGELVPQDIVVTDTLPAGVSFVSAEGSDWVCSNNAQVIRCQFTGAFTTNLPQITVKASVDVSSVAAETVINNAATVSASNESPANVGANNEAQASVLVSNKVNLAVSKSTSASVIASGQEYQYSIKIKNNGPLAVLPGQTMTVSDQLDGQLQFLGVAAGSPWVCTPESTTAAELGKLLSCTFKGGIAAGGTSELLLNVVAHIDAANGKFASIANGAALTGMEGRDGAPLNVIASSSKVNISESKADLSISKSAEIPGASKASGAEVVYTLRVKNDVPQGAENADLQTAQTVTVTDTIGNLLTDYSAGVLGVTAYANNRYLTAEVQMPADNGAEMEACSISGNNNQKSATVSCTLRNLPADPAVDYVIVIKARQYVDPQNNDTQTNTLVNEASVGSPDTAEFNTDNNRAKASVEMEALTDLTVTKQAAPESAAAGQAITYTLTAKNSGPSQARQVRVTDQLPVASIWVGKAPVITGGSCALSAGAVFAAGLEITEANRTMTCAWDDAMGENAQKTVTYQLRSRSKDYPPQLDNSVVVASVTPETDTSNNSANEAVPLDKPQVDVLVNMRHTNDGIPLDTGNTQYTITVTNSGASQSYATGVQMLDQFPAPGSTADFRFVSLDSVQMSSGDSRIGLDSCVVPAAGALAGTLVCDFPWLAPSESVVIKFTMEPASLLDGRAVGTINHRASVTADVEALDGVDVSKNNQTTDRTSTYDPAQVSPDDLDKLRYVDLSLTKTTSATGAVDVGDLIAYTLTVKNEEDPSANPRMDLVNGQAVVSDVLPEGLVLEGATPAGCGYEEASRTLRCEISTLNAGDEVAFPFSVKLLSRAEGQTSIVNTATLTSPGDTDESNNDSRTETPLAVVDLALLKTVDKAQAAAGDTLVYSLTVVNNGPADSREASLTDVLPEGLVFVQASPACQFDEGSRTLSCALEPLAVGASVALTVETTVDAALEGPLSLVNTAVVDLPGDSEPRNNESSVTTTIPGKNTGGEDDKPGGQVVPVPVLSSAALLLMALAMAGLAAVRLGRRSR